MTDQTKTPLERQQTVMIYHDPITRQKPEGEATLVYKIWDSLEDRMDCWRVRFGNGPETYQRRIKTD